MGEFVTSNNGENKLYSDTTYWVEQVLMHIDATVDI